ncbi:metabolite traffic protein EboE [Dichotomicrobium thermohalophilum]|uniref:Sugar phosphate isomerase/epimerase n=1 Tax=Dichotomicrobium thermohalophilum TaxID=933063 RepID=A0A397PDX7_9HYPH|nr:metabolite traffic protein EboE [Dichotomicrobium thermohalophilum]RIA45425.1 sugar phosphate isomerase/epimerase [Dichotomicrobium thermohalophilum]
MHLRGELGCLTYCTNIHPGETWAETRRTVAERVTRVKQRVCPEQPFGVGLRLSARAAEALAAPNNLEDFAALLSENDLYVFTINGFPYGPFHDTTVKAKVYEPSWAEGARLDYTNRLADLLARLLPEGMTGSISTVPCAFRPVGRGQEEAMREHLLRHAVHLHRISEETGKQIALALEPEPHCYLETTGEALTFFQDWLLNVNSVRRMGELTGLSSAQAEQALRRHLGVCFDVCHAAVEYEDPGESVAALRGAGIAVPKLQLSAALHLRRVTPETLERLRAFDEETYLHQVVARRGETLERFLDLPDAFAAAEAQSYDEWRVHFHVPLFLAELEHFSTTQHVLAEVLELHRQAPISDHLEVETYTWDVLPPDLRNVPVEDAIARELSWVTTRLNA